MRSHIHECVYNLIQAGIDQRDGEALRRISMTLHRWHELECGDGNDDGSWCITRGRKETRHGQHAGGHGAHSVFLHDDDGAPFLEYHPYRRGANSVIYSRLADRETGAKKRLAKILARYPGFTAYVQGDPRGCALYILRPGDVPAGATVDSCYNRGIAVYK